MNKDMEIALTELLKGLVDVFNKHSEYGDTLCKELLGDYLWQYYVHKVEAPSKESIDKFIFGLDDEKGERAVRNVMHKNIFKLVELSEKAGMDTNDRYDSLYSDIEFDGYDISEFIGERDIDVM